MIDRELQPNETIVFVSDHPTDWPLRRLMRMLTTLGDGRKTVHVLESAKPSSYGKYYLVPVKSAAWLDEIKGISHRPNMRLDMFQNMNPVLKKDVVHHREKKEPTVPE
jgi:hypothetical protein